jgi:hypothetical protein
MYGSESVVDGIDCALADAKERAESWSLEVDDYVFVLRDDSKEEFIVSIINSDIDDRNLLLLYYAGEEIYY